jgi:hypothetical protein
LARFRRNRVFGTDRPSGPCIYNWIPSNYGKVADYPGGISWPIAWVAVSGATRNYLGIAYVCPLMQKVIPSMSRWTVAIGAAVFIGVLFISAYWEADIRWLHFFQAWMYLATIILAWKGSRWLGGPHRRGSRGPVELYDSICKYLPQERVGASFHSCPHGTPSAP